MTKETKVAATVSANPAFVEFPRDVWGSTTDLRKAGLRAASAVRGSPERHALFLATLRILAQHSMARLAPDADAIQERGRLIAEREASAFHRVASNTPAIVTADPAPAEPEAPTE